VREITKITCHGKSTGGIARTVNAADQARHEGDEEEDTSHTHLSNASLRRGMACAREKWGRGREEARGSVLTNPTFFHLLTETIVSSLSKSAMGDDLLTNQRRKDFG